MEIEIDGLASGAGLMKPDLIEEGIIVDVLDGDDEPIYLDAEKTKKRQVRVRSYRCQAVKSLQERIQRRTAALNRGRRKQDATIPNDEFMSLSAAACCAELINFSVNSPSQKPTEEALVKLFSDVRFEPLRELIWETSRMDSKYEAPGKAPVDAAATSTSAET